MFFLQHTLYHMVTFEVTHFMGRMSSQIIPPFTVMDNSYSNKIPMKLLFDHGFHLIFLYKNGWFED
jgi:hypothetical protein